MAHWWRTSSQVEWLPAKKVVDKDKKQCCEKQEAANGIIDLRI